MIDPMNNQPAEFLFTARDNRGRPGRFDYYRGPTGHVFIGEIPSDLEDYYEEGYQPIPKNEAELARVAKGDAYRLDRIKQLVPTGTFLEIGSWIGLVSYSAKKAGYDVSVLERDARCVRLLQDVGINAVQTDDPAAALVQSGKTYDAIGLWHSIEHLPRPWEVIEAAAKAVNPGGVLLVAAPNPESAQMRVLGKRWVHLDAPRHIHLLPMGDIEEIARRNGLVVLEKTTNDELGKIIDKYGWQSVGYQTPFRHFNHRLNLWRVMTRMFRRSDLDGGGFTLILKRPKN